MSFTRLVHLVGHLRPFYSKVSILVSVIESSSVKVTEHARHDVSWAIVLIAPLEPFENRYLKAPKLI